MNRPAPQRLAPLSFPQEELIRHATAHAGAAARYDSFSLYRLDGDVDRELLGQALQDVVTRHPALRTVIRAEHDRLVQRVCPPEEMAQVKRDGRVGGSISGLAAELERQRYGTADILAGRPLFRAGLHERESAHLLSIAINHLIYDGWSLGVLWRDLGECYSARKERRAAQIPRLPTTYADYATSQRRDLPRLLGSAVTFYRAALGDCTGVIDWPGPGDTDALSPTDRGQVSVHVSGAPVAAVRAVSRTAKVSPFVVLMTATASAISRVSGQPDLIVGVDTANRDDPALPDLVGFFLNTRMIRVRTTGADDLPTAVGKIRASWYASAAYDNVYYDQVLAAIGERQLTKIDMPTLSPSGWAAIQLPRLSGVSISEVPTPATGSTWRDLSVAWQHARQGYRCDIFHRRAAVSAQIARGIGEQILAAIPAARPEGAVHG